jgi:hypothetical protein
MPDRIASYQKKKGNNDPQSPVPIASLDWIASQDLFDRSPEFSYFNQFRSDLRQNKQKKAAAADR